MNNNLNQPGEFDLVLGGQAQPPAEGIVLGGIKGVKSRLTSKVVEARIAAVSEALNYEEAGLNLVIKALKDPCKQVQRSACRLLRERTEPHIEQVLQKYWMHQHDHSLFYTTWANWKVENFDPNKGIIDPFGIAYVLRIDQFNLLLQDPQVGKIEALVCEMRSCDLSYSLFVDIFCAACKHLKNLKAVFIGDYYDLEYIDYKRLSLNLSNFSPILEAYSNLELLHIRGLGDLEFKRVQQNNLKTLIVETKNLVDKTIDYLCNLNLPALEYLDLGLGKDYYNQKYTTDVFMPILSGKLFPKLTYLGLHGNEYNDKIAYALTISAVIERLKVLDLSQGNLGDKGAEALLRSIAVNRLHTLNVSKNHLSTKVVNKLSKLNCQVRAESQYRDRYYRYYSAYE